MLVGTLLKSFFNQLLPSVRVQKTDCCLARGVGVVHTTNIAPVSSFGAEMCTKTALHMCIEYSFKNKQWDILQHLGDHNLAIGDLTAFDEAYIIEFLVKNLAYFLSQSPATLLPLVVDSIRYKKWQVLACLVDKGLVALHYLQDFMSSNKKHTRTYKPELAVIIAHRLMALAQQEPVDKKYIFTMAMVSDSLEVLDYLLQDAAFVRTITTEDCQALSSQVACSVRLIQERPDLLQILLMQYCAKNNASAAMGEPALIMLACAYPLFLSPESIHILLVYMCTRWRAYPLAVRTQVLGAFVEAATFEQIRALYKAGAKVLQSDFVLHIIYQKFSNKLCLSDIAIFFKEAHARVVTGEALTDNACHMLSNLAMRQLGNVVYERISAPSEIQKYRKRYPHLIDQEAFYLACQEPRLRRPFIIWAARNGELYQFEALMPSIDHALLSEALRETIVASKREDCAGPLESRLKLLHRILERVPDLHQQLSHVVINRCLQVALEIRNAEILKALQAHFFVYQGNPKVTRQISAFLSQSSAVLG